MHTVAVVSVAFPTLAAHGHRIGIVGDDMVLTARDHHSLVHHVLVCAHFLGQGALGQQLLTIAVL